MFFSPFHKTLPFYTRPFPLRGDIKIKLNKNFTKRNDHLALLGKELVLTLLKKLTFLDFLYLFIVIFPPYYENYTITMSIGSLKWEITPYIAFYDRNWAPSRIKWGGVYSPHPMIRRITISAKLIAKALKNFARKKFLEVCRTKWRR